MWGFGGKAKDGLPSAGSPWLAAGMSAPKTGCSCAPLFAGKSPAHIEHKVALYAYALKNLDARHDMLEIVTNYGGVSALLYFSSLPLTPCSPGVTGPFQPDPAGGDD